MRGGRGSSGPSQEELDAATETRALNAKQMELIDAQRGEIAERKRVSDQQASETKATEDRKAANDAGTGTGLRSLLSGNWTGYEREQKPQALRSLLGGSFRRGGDLGAQ